MTLRRLFRNALMTLIAVVLVQCGDSEFPGYPPSFEWALLVWTGPDTVDLVNNSPPCSCFQFTLPPYTSDGHIHRNSVFPSSSSLKEHICSWKLTTSLPGPTQTVVGSVLVSSVMNFGSSHTLPYSLVAQTGSGAGTQLTYKKSIDATAIGAPLNFDISGVPNGVQVYFSGYHCPTSS